jgi:hypothetical protein
MQAREDRPLVAPLELDALGVHRDVDDARRGGHQRQRGGQRAEPRRDADRQQRRREDREAEPQPGAAPHAGDQRRARREADDGAGLEPDDRDGQLAGREVEPLLDRRDPRRPRGVQEAGEEEHRDRRDAGVAVAARGHGAGLPGSRHADPSGSDMPVLSSAYAEGYSAAISHQ